MTHYDAHRHDREHLCEETTITEGYSLNAREVDFARRATVAMATALNIDMAAFRLISETSDGDGRRQRVLVMDASPNGQFIGTYGAILTRRDAEPDWYTLDIDGRRIDPLAGCTRLAYHAMILNASERGDTHLPDSLALSQHNGHVWTAAMMTGDPLPAERTIWIGSSSGGGKVNFVQQQIDRGGRSFRVRPAVEVSDGG